MGVSYLRQQDLVDGGELASLSVVVIGVGAVGSFTALSLAKMGVERLTIFDCDKVEAHNLPNQFYRLLDLGRPKVEALRDIIRDYAGIEIEVHQEKYLNQPLKGVVIVAVDSMDERTKIWRAVKKFAGVGLLIDARMGAEVAQLHTINPLFDVADYERTLYPSSEAFQEPCTRKAIIYTAMGIACMICGEVKKYVQGEVNKKSLVMDFKLGELIALT